MFFVLGFVAKAQTNLRTIMADTNGVVQRPTNFWIVNSNSINSIINAAFSSAFSPSIFVLKYKNATFANLLSQVSGSATASATNSIAIFSIPSTNTNAISGLRIIRDIDSSWAGGTGTAWGKANHSIWISFDIATSLNGFARMTLGHNSSLTTNIGAELTNRGVGFEINSTNGSNLQIRLIGHNGTNSTNGPWIAISDIYQRYTVGIEQKTNGNVNLYIGTNYGNAIINSNASISNGPTTTGSGGNHALDFRLESTNTNSYNAGSYIYSVIVETSQ